MGKTYEGEHILEQMGARLVPPDDRYPDCQCAVVLTEEYFYILEDNFDGTYETHIAIPTADILDIAQEEVLPESGKQDKDASQAMAGVAAAFMGLVGGLLAYRASGKAVRPTKYLRVRYRDEAGEERRLYCKECGGSIKRMGKALQKYRERRAL